MQVVKALAALLFVVAVPLAIVSTNLRLMVFDRGLWERGYERHRVGATTGMSPEQLRVASDQIIAYFGGGPMVSLQVQKEWGRELLFNPREQTHLSDVRDLLWGALRVGGITLGYLVVVAAVLLIRRAPRPLAKLLSAGAGLTLAIFAGLGLLAVGNFGDFWLQFHLVSFSNEFWQLDPRTDYMIRLYPQDFWFDMIVELFGRSIITALVLLVAGQVYLRLGARTRVQASA